MFIYAFICKCLREFMEKVIVLSHSIYDQIAYHITDYNAGETI